MILTGHRNWFSEITQAVTGSRFGHVIIYLGDDRFIEATDVALTPWETDEGVYPRDARYFRQKAARMGDICVLRPKSVHLPSFIETAERMLRHSPPYPSVGAVLLGFACLLAGLTVALPAIVRDRFIDLQYRLVGDGPTRMHCAEAAVRLFAAAGTPIELRRPVLGHLIEHSRRLRAGLVPLPTTRRRAEEGTWPANRMMAVLWAVIRTVTTIRERLDRTIPRDHACFVMPADLERSPTFRAVIDITRSSAGWLLVENDPVPVGRRSPSLVEAAR